MSGDLFHESISSQKRHSDSWTFSLANFTVLSGANALQRDPSPGGGIVENGVLKLGKTVQTNSTNNTVTGIYFISNDPVEDL